jgi:hypothetical protein
MHVRHPARRATIEGDQELEPAPRAELPTREIKAIRVAHEPSGVREITR